MSDNLTIDSDRRKKLNKKRLIRDKNGLLFLFKILILDYGRKELLARIFCFFGDWADEV